MRRAERIVIIGGGLAGLSAGISLLRQGRRVALFEAGDRVGGCCTTTQSEGFTFNNGALYVALPALLDTAFERLALDRAALLPLRRITALQTTRVADDAIVRFRTGCPIQSGPIGGSLSDSDSDAQRDAVRLRERWTPLLDLLTKEILVRPFSLPRLLCKGWRELPKLRGTVADELNRLVREPSLRAAMGSVTLYTGLPPEETPAMQLIGLVAMLAGEFYLPEGGMGNISEVLHSQFQQLGGELHLGTTVERILVESGRASGIVVRDCRVAADAVVSTTSAMATYRNLLTGADSPGRQVRRAVGAPISQKAFSVQLGLRNHVAADSHFMGYVPRLESLRELLVPPQGAMKWLCYSVPTVTMPSLAPSGGSVIEAFPAIDQSIPAEEWTPSHSAQVARDTIAVLSRLHDLDIAVTRIRSPRHFLEDLHLFAGAIYGLSPAADARAQFPHKSPIPGLYLAGQTTYPGYGVAPAMLSGIFAADLVH